MYNRIINEVAVLQHHGLLPDQFLEIAKVAHSGEAFIQLADGRMYATLGGAGLNTNTCISLAVEEHRAAMKEKMALAN
jgi:hypothetical protein